MIQASGRARADPPAYDAVFFIFAPLLGLALSFLLQRPAGVGQPITFIDPHLAYWAPVWTYAHLCAVVFRSHLNPAIFGQHRGRFIAVPVLVYAGLVSSQWLFAGGLVLIVFWDVYHTTAQNFGFCRITTRNRAIHLSKAARWTSRHRVVDREETSFVFSVSRGSASVDRRRFSDSSRSWQRWESATARAGKEGSPSYRSPS